MATFKLSAPPKAGMVIGLEIKGIKLVEMP
jgi:hypothetical protein